MEREILGLHNLVGLSGARQKAKRVGRGESSGMGKTSGRGHKGQKARKSGNVRPGFEGGQNPLTQSHPKRGFTSRKQNLEETCVINVKHLGKVFAKGDEVTPSTLIAKGLLSKKNARVKILGEGDLDVALVVKVDSVSAGAKKKITACGGSVETV